MLRPTQLCLSALILTINIFSIGYAEENNAPPSLAPIISNGDFRYIEVTIQSKHFRVTPEGRLLNAKSSNSQGIAFLNIPQAQKVEGVEIEFYPCQSQANTFFISNGCINQNGQSGPVKRIDHFIFNYYPIQQGNGNSNFDPNSGNYGKIQTAGDYHFTYFSLNAFGNKGGKVNSVTHAGNTINFP